MSKIIISMLPELGHTNATLKLAKSLMARGHEVYYLCCPEYNEYMQKQGMRYITLGDGVMDNVFPGMVALMEELLEIRIHCRPLDQQFAGIVEVFRRQIEALAQDLQPDLFMIDPYTPEIALIAQQLSLPYVFLNNVLFSPLEDTPLIHTAPYLSRVPEVILCPQEFDFPEQVGRGGRKLYFVGAEVDLQRHEDPFDWTGIDPEKPLIYCSFGSQVEKYLNTQRFFETIIEAVGSLRHYQLVLATGANYAHDGFKNVPANVLLLKHAPQLQILQRSSMLITHGGMNSIKEALCYGVPLVVFPCQWDQPMNAARVACHRLGVTGDVSSVTVEQARSLIQKVAETDLYRERANHFREIFMQYEERQVSVTVVEAFLRLLSATHARSASADTTSLRKTVVSR